MVSSPYERILILVVYQSYYRKLHACSFDSLDHNYSTPKEKINLLRFFL